MTDRIIDIADGPARLSVDNARLLIRHGEEAEVAIPLQDIAAVVVSQHAVTYTHAVLARLAAAGAAFVACDSRHMPVGMLLPVESHSTQAERFQLQVAASEPTRKRIWQQLIEAKVAAQGRLLAALRGDDQGLLALSRHVQSGDAGQTESLAARRYWPALFADPNFRRDREADDQNRFLNYGYGVLRAIVARAICGAGLHPSFGVHHHNRYDAFALADDLIEPFRPIVDGAVARWVIEHGAAGPLDRDVKAALIGALTARFTLEDESRTLFEIVARTAASLAQVFSGGRKDLVLPQV